MDQNYGEGEKKNNRNQSNVYKTLNFGNSVEKPKFKKFFNYISYV